jgi:hypothetical protein
MNEVVKNLVEPDLRELLRAVKGDIFSSLNCHAIGTILLFDPATKTANIKLSYMKQADGELTPKEYPTLMNCPVVILSGGLARLTFPILPGDSCMVFFNDRDIDFWFQTGIPAPPLSSRKHALSDGIALVGLNSLVSAATFDYDPLRALLKYGPAGGEVGVGPLLVRIANSVTTLKAVINGLIDITKTAYTIPTVPGAPAPLDPVVIAQLEAYKVVVASLLE